MSGPRFVGGSRFDAGIASDLEDYQTWGQDSSKE
jgi:hypothetical protein